MLCFLIRQDSTSYPILEGVQRDTKICTFLISLQNIWASSQENLILLHASNKGAEQPGYPRNLISTFVFHPLQSIISKLASCKISLL